MNDIRFRNANEYCVDILIKNTDDKFIEITISAEGSDKKANMSVCHGLISNRNRKEIYHKNPVSPTNLLHALANTLGYEVKKIIKLI